MKNRCPRCGFYIVVKNRRPICLKCGYGRASARGLKPDPVVEMLFALLMFEAVNELSKRFLNMDIKRAVREVFGL